MCPDKIENEINDHPKYSKNWTKIGHTSNLSTYSGSSSSTQRIKIQRYSDNYRSK